MESLPMVISGGWRRSDLSRGAWTLEARGVMPTLSSPNWESAIGGASPEQHGITSNGHFRRMAAFRSEPRGVDTRGARCDADAQQPELGVGNRRRVTRAAWNHFQWSFPADGGVPI